MDINIKSPEELNAYIDGLETKIATLETEAAKAGDVELVKAENAEMKTALENMQKLVEDIKEAKQEMHFNKSEDERKYLFGKFCYAVAKKDTKTVFEMGGKVNASANKEDWKPAEWDIGQKAATDLGTPLRGDATTGSYLIPDELAAEVLRVPEDNSGMMGKVRTVPMATRKITYPAKLAGVEYTWVTNEITAKTEDNPTFSEVDLECETAAAWVAMTEEFQEDTIVDMGQYLAQLFREAWWTEFDKQCLVADSAPFDGVMQATGVNAVTMSAGNTSFCDVTDEDLLAVVQALDSQAKRQGAAFIMHCTIHDYLKSLKDDLGNPIYAPIAGAVPNTIHGYPVIYSDAMPDADSSDVSTPFIAFGNPKHIIHGDRVGIEFRIFDQTSDALVYDRNFFRVRLRQGFVTGVPGAFAKLSTPAS